MAHNSTNTITLTNNSVIYFTHLTFQPASRTKIFLGSRDSGNYLKVDAEWGELSQIAKRHLSVAEIADHLKKVYPKYFPGNNHLSKVKLFLLHLAKHKLIHKIDHQTIFTVQPIDYSNVKKGNLVLKPLFVPLFGLSILAMAASFILPFIDPGLVPQYQDFFWSKSYSISLISFFVLSWLLGMLHEIGHFLTALSKGVIGKIGFSHRLNFLVVETRYPNILSIPKKWRLLTFMSGIIVDFVVISVCSALAFLHTQTVIALDQNLYLFLKQIILLQWLAIVWQFLFYMKTDIYYIVREAVNIPNLYTYAKFNVKKTVLGSDSSLLLSKRERLIVNGYTLFFAVGVAAAILRYGVYHIPITVRLTKTAISNILTGFESHNLTTYIDGGVVLTIQVFTLFMLLDLLYKERIKKNSLL